MNGGAGRAPPRALPARPRGAHTETRIHTKTDSEWSKSCLPAVSADPRERTQMSDSPFQSSALDALRALANKKPAEHAPSLTIQVTDPAIAGAKRDKNTVKLGVDPAFHEKAAYGATLKAALERASSDFEVVQAELRDYGRDKRRLYNETYKTTVTTVGVPYSVETPEGPETKYVNVICSNKYSVQKEVVLNNTEALGDWQTRLFNIERTKRLKPNAEEHVRKLFIDLGLKGDELEAALDVLFETDTKVTTREDFEQQEAQAPVEIRTILSQAVTRAQPGLKFS